MERNWVSAQVVLSVDGAVPESSVEQVKDAGHSARRISDIVIGRRDGNGGMLTRSRRKKGFHAFSKLGGGK